VSKLVAAALSGSLSIMSAVIDSIVDLVSGTVIWLVVCSTAAGYCRATVYLIDNHNPHEYPRGRRRLEPVAVILVSMVMGLSNVVMILQAIEMTVKNDVI
jgi:divalent metal cation (Fe/Co/Zn/Cd) transporter